MDFAQLASSKNGFRRNFPARHKHNLRKLHLHLAGKSPKNIASGELGLRELGVSAIRTNCV